MKMQLMGWGRVEYVHDHNVVPIVRQENGGLKAGNDAESR